MWKSIVLCASLFGGAALGLALGARFVEPAALPAAAAIGLCIIGVVLILAAPTSDTMIEGEATALVPMTKRTKSLPAVDTMELPRPAVANRTPALPFEALNS